MEYLFKKDELLKLINASGSSNYIAINLNFVHAAAKGEFRAEITARAITKDAATGVFSEAPGDGGAYIVNGCPNPPGCD